MTAQATSKLVGGAYARLKEDIRTNRLAPGFQATEPEIALRLGMSRTPVREALIRLEGEGLVEMIPRRGVRVRPVLASDMREIYEMLTALEPEAAARLTARGLTGDELRRLGAQTDRMQAALGSGDLDAWAEADDAFHCALLEMHGNARMLQTVTALFDQAHRARIVTLRLRAPPVRSTEEHRGILMAMAQGDAARVRTLFRAHRERAARELLDLLENTGLPGL